MRFVKMPNKIFSFSLSPKSIYVYAFLLTKVNVLQTAICSYKEIATACNMDAKTVLSALSELNQVRLVFKENRYNAIGYAKNKYFVKNLIEYKNQKSVDWFSVESDIFSTKIKSTDFCVYCYLKSCMDYKDKTAFPSLTAISKATHISRSRVAKAIKFLRDNTYLNRIKRKYKQTKAYRHNKYFHFIVRKSPEKTGISHIKKIRINNITGILSLSLSSMQINVNRCKNLGVVLKFHNSS